MRKITQLIVTLVLDDLTEETAEAYASLLSSDSIGMRLIIGTSSWPFHGASGIVNTIEIEETTSEPTL